MIFIKDKTKQFILNIKNYEFLNSDILEDLDWLNIEILVSDDFNQWKASGPYLRTLDLTKLYLWFIKLNEGKEVESRINFLENELSFEYKKDEQELSINLDFNLHPKGKKYDYNHDTEYKLIFELKNIDINIILKSLKKIINDFPIRYFHDNSSVN